MTELLETRAEPGMRQWTRIMSLIRRAQELEKRGHRALSQLAWDCVMELIREVKDPGFSPAGALRLACRAHLRRPGMMA